MPVHLRRRGAVLAVAAVLTLAACSGGGGSGGNSAGGDGDGDGGACPVGALDEASGPVTITFWHGLSQANEKALQQLVADFNGSQAKVKVDLVNQTGYEEILRKWVAGLGTGDLPDVAQLEDTATQQMIDTQSVVPVSACIKADGFDASDIVERVRERYTVDGTLWPMPFNVSNPVLYYDKNAFTAAGLDPEKPPATLAEVKADAAKIKDAGYEAGFGLKLNPWYLEQWAAKSDTYYANNQNGRSSRASAAVFDDATGRESFAWMKDMVDSGLARTNPDDGPNGFDNLLGIRSKIQGMTIDSSAALGQISQILSSGQGGGVKLGVGPMPGPEGAGGVLVGGAALYLSKESAPEKIAAGWEFLKYIVRGDTQAKFAAATGYVPITKSALDEQVLVDQWAKEPGYRVAYDQMLTGKDDTRTAGPVIGDYLGVRGVVKDAQTKMLTEGTSSDAALRQAQKDATTKIQDYNARVAP